jgi:EAL domain-containing protein (putative c-di-GMP-specific phosphodiesterase class I)/GGDEF domain-containing protein
VEPRFDQYARLAATTLKAPIAVVARIDSDGHSVKTTYGIDAPAIPAELSFFRHSAAETEIFCVSDALEDRRFAADAVVVGHPYIRSYAGIAIRNQDGVPVGACCVMDTEPRVLVEHEQSTLRQIACMIENEIRVEQELNDLKQQLQAQALFDEATGLPNSVSFSSTLRKTLDDAGTTAPSVVLALIRIERFDALDAALGGAATAFLVQELAARIRAEAPLGSIVGRLRDDILGLLFTLHDGSRENAVLDHLIASVRDPVMLAEHSVPLQIGVGASVYPRDAADADSLLKRARTALWSRPLSERSGYTIYRRHHSDHASRQFQIETALRRGLEHGEFRLVYQPKIDIKRKGLVGAEVLLRWTSNTLGDVSPETFIPIAEERGILGTLGTWVLGAASAQLETWQRNGYTCPELAINITSFQLRQEGFYDEIKALLERHRGLRGRLNLEVTEGSLVEDLESAVEIMSSLRKLGVTFSIDDFGTGFSSLSYLRKMPLHSLKIDRSFINTIPDRPEDMRLVRSIVSMGHDLELKVVAEGVETERQYAFLRSVGCDQVQGYLFSAPLEVPEFEHYQRTFYASAAPRSAGGLSAWRARLTFSRS